MTRRELLLWCSNSKKGAEFRIADAVKNGEEPSPRDIAMLDNKPGRPHKDQGSLPFGDLGEWEIIENYWELREHGIRYEDACEIAAHLHFLNWHKDIGPKTVRAIITANRNKGKEAFSQRYGEKAEEKWRRYEMEEKAYFRERKVFWSRGIDEILSK